MDNLDNIYNKYYVAFITMLFFERNLLKIMCTKYTINLDQGHVLLIYHMHA